MKSYLVGGAVRDIELGIVPKDHDWVVVGGTPEQMEALGYEQVGADFPVFIHPETGDEYALARQERKSGTGYTGFSVEFGPEITLEQDLRRRDLTINAMAMTDDRELVDPYGGQKDLANGILRHVDEEAFVEDPLRALRLARFAARYPDFTIDPKTMDLVYKIGRSGELKDLTSERVFKEMIRALMEPAPRRFFDTLLHADVLHIVFPEVYALLTSPESFRHHPEGNSYEHVMLVLTAMSKIEGYSETDMVNALCHDLGKSLTALETLPAHHGHEEAGVEVAEAFLGRLRAPSKMIDMAKKTTRFHMYMHWLEGVSPRKICKMFNETLTNSEDFVGHLVRLGKADKRGRLGSQDRDMSHLDQLFDLEKAFRSVKFADAVGDTSLKGHVIKQKMHAARVKAVKKRKEELEEQRQERGLKP